jgi:hypothetical protein
LLKDFGGEGCFVREDDFGAGGPFDYKFGGGAVVDGEGPEFFDLGP